MPKSKRILKDIKDLIYTQRDKSIYGASEILDSIIIYLDKYYKDAKENNQSWKLCTDAQFHADLERLSISDMAFKYNVSYHAIYYHLNKLTKESTTEGNNECSN